MIQAIVMCLDFARPNWSTGTQLVAIALADRVNTDSLECWPSIADIARRTRMTERSVQRHIRDLEQDGTITRMRRTRRSDGLAGSNVWRWNLLITLPPEVTPLSPGR